MNYPNKFVSLGIAPAFNWWSSPDSNEFYLLGSGYLLSLCYEKYETRRTSRFDLNNGEASF